MTSTSPNGVAQQEIKGSIDVRVATLGGALVLVIRLDDPPVHDHAWQCLGCGRTNNRASSYLTVDSKDEALDGANEHAADCRAVPGSPECAAPPSSGDVLVAAELVRTRTEIGQLAGAARELTEMLDSVAGELGWRVTEFERVVDTGLADLVVEAAEVCTELAEVGAALRPVEPPAAVEPSVPVERRRRWLWGGAR